MTSLLLTVSDHSRTEYLNALKEVLTDEQVETILESGRLSTRIAAPLTRVSSERELNAMLPGTAMHLLSTIHRMVQPVSEIAIRQEVWEILQQVNAKSMNDVARAAAEQLDLIGEDNHEKLNGAIESAKAFEAWQINAAKSGNIYANLTWPLIGEAYAHSLAIRTALFSILLNLTQDWNVEAIPILIGAFDDCMTAIEDVFLGQDWDDVQDDEPVPYSQVKASLGL